MEISLYSITNYLPIDVIYIILSYCNVLIEKSLNDIKIKFLNKLNKKDDIFNLLLEKPCINLVNSMINRYIFVPNVYLYIKPNKWCHLFYGYINDFYEDNDEDYIEENFHSYIITSTGKDIKL